MGTASEVPTAQWIWGTPGGNEKAQAGRCEFQYQFSLAKPKQGELIITCDNQYLVRINGRLVGMGDDWEEQERYDVSELLKDGENTIYVRCRNTDAGPAGLLAQLSVESENGSQTIVTDDRWEAKVQHAGTWDPTIIRRTPWTPVHRLGTAGETDPWGKVRLAEKVQVVRPSVSFGTGPLQLESGDRVLFVGSTLIERAQKYGLIEQALTTRFPNQHVLFRNLGWSGDTVFGHARARFGTVADGFDHLETHVFAEKPNLILVGYGTNEAFAGEAGLDEFVQGLHLLVDTLSSTGARIALLSPVRQENLGSPLPDPTEQNRRISLYRDAIRQVAEDRRCGFIYLYALVKPTSERKLTDNGMHLTPHGYAVAARAFEAGFAWPDRQRRLVADWQAKSIEAEGAMVTDVSAADQELQFDVLDVMLPSPITNADSHAERTLTVQGLPPGQYQLAIDGGVITVADQQRWQNGVAIVSGPEIEQANRLQETINQKNELYFHRWRPQNETYLFLFRKHEQGNNAVEISQFDPLIESKEQEIATLRVPQTHHYRFRRIE